MPESSILHHLFARWSLYRGLVLLLLLLLCLNVIALSLIGNYDIRFGFVYLTAHGLFKPILMMNGFFVIALMVFGAGHKLRDPMQDYADEILRSPGLYNALLIVLVVLLVLTIYYPSIDINFNHHDWTHRHISAGVNSIHSAWQLFTKPQADGFYRPLTFLSLWMDYRLFGTAYEGYHIQSITLHIINSLLATWLALSLGFNRKCSLWTGFLFACAAVNFEAVTWPAARFDLLAAAFTLAALILGIRCFRDVRNWTWALPASLVCYMLGIMNKESSYCFPLLILFVIGTHPIWAIQRPEKAKTALYFSLVAAITALMIFVRIAIYGNLGGYPTIGVTESHHFKIGVKTFISLLRAMPIPILGINTSSVAPGWMRAAPIILALTIIPSVVYSRGCFRRKEYALTACIVLALVPVVNIVGWLGTPMQHSRYLYLPSFFVVLLIASTLGRIHRSVFLLGAILAVNAMGAMSNIRVYLNMLARTEKIARSIQSDWMRRPTVHKICLVSLPENPGGVFFFGSELVERIGRKIPSATILRQDTYVSTDSNASDRITYQWDDADRTLHLIEQP